MVSFRLTGVAVSLSIAFLLGACSIIRGPLGYAASPTTDPDQVQLNLNALLDPSGNSQTLEKALAAFPDTEERRNAVVGALLMASERNCDIYMENLRGYQSTWRTGFSLASVALGAAGSIVTDSASARLLSGLSGASTGASGKLDENILGGMAAEVMLSGVRAAREPYRRAILDNLDTDYSEWPVEIAIADVFRYHGRCNVVSGLAAAQNAIEDDILPPDDGGDAS